MNTSISLLIKKILPFIFIFLFAYLINSALFFFLPKTGVDYIKNDNLNLSYKRYSGFYSNVKKVEKKVEKKEVVSLTKYKLKAIYAKDDSSGWIVIEDANGTNNYILKQNEEINGYKLIEIFRTFVFFSKSDKRYKLELTKDESELSYAVENNNALKEDIVVNNDSTVVSRDYLNSYVNNVDKIWNNIAINETRTNGKIDGFKIFDIKKGSAFEKIGLKKGDVIKSINNEALDSYAKAFKAYNNINNTKYLSIEIMRNNEIVELNYEIN